MLFKFILIRWHRRLGVLSALLIIFLSISGIVLNHIENVYKSQPFVSSNLLLNWYGIKMPVTVYGYQLNSEKNSNRPSDIIWADGTILINQEPELFNQQQILGLKKHQDILYLFTKNTLHLFTLDGHKIESTALTAPDNTYFSRIQSISTSSVIALTSAETVLLYDLEKMQFIDELNQAYTLKDNLNSPIPSRNVDAELARRFILLKSKVLLDVHSGRILGRIGPFIIDFFALAFLLLAISGLYIWSKRKPT